MSTERRSPFMDPNDPHYSDTPDVSLHPLEGEKNVRHEAEPDFLDGAVLEYRECMEVRRLLGYLWTATGSRAPDMPVRDLFNDDDPIIADVERLAIFPAAEEDRDD